MRPYVVERHIGDIALQVDDSRIHLRNGYWYIPICPSRCFLIMRRSLRLRMKSKSEKA